MVCFVVENKGSAGMQKLSEKGFVKQITLCLISLRMWFMVWDNDLDIFIKNLHVLKQQLVKWRDSELQHPTANGCNVISLSLLTLSFTYAHLIMFTTTVGISATISYYYKGAVSNFLPLKGIGLLGLKWDLEKCKWTINENYIRS